MADVSGLIKKGFSYGLSIDLLSFRHSFYVDLGQIHCHRWQFSVEFLKHLEALEVACLQAFHQSCFPTTSIRKKSDKFCCAQFQQHIGQDDLFGEQETDHPRRVFTQEDFPEGLVLLSED